MALAIKPSKRDLKEEKARRKLTRNFTLYKRRIFRRYEHAPHLEVLDRDLEQIALYTETNGEQGLFLLIVEMPPRHGKTMTISRLFPSWYLGRNPDNRTMLVSYGHSLAIKNSRMARNLMRSPWFQAIFPSVDLADDSAAADAWDIKGCEGGCDAMGIGGAATGKGAHVLIIDDPVKNRQEAESEVYRERNWDAFTNDLYTRLEPGGAIVVVGTRWHQHDLIGRLVDQLAKEGEPRPWKRLRLPAIAEDENDALGRKPGEALWPWRYPLQVLEKVAKAVGRYVWAALYQQRPAPREGGIFQWKDIETYRAKSHPALAEVVIALDPSGTANGDACGIVAAGRGHDNHLYVLGDWTIQASPARWARRAVNAYRYYKADRINAEKNFGGEMVELTIHTVDKRIRVILISASRGKDIRADPVAALYEQGVAHHVGEFPDMEEEMTTWKHGMKSPNRMDALVFAATDLMLGPTGEVEVSDRNPFYEDY